MVMVILIYCFLESCRRRKYNKISEYVKATNKYKPSDFDVSDIMNAERIWDLDGDGDLDFVIAGEK
jgi:hypothetical protein